MKNVIQLILLFVIFAIDYVPKAANCKVSPTGSTIVYAGFGDMPGDSYPASAMLVATLTYSTDVYIESPENDGSIDNTIEITCNNVGGETFTGIDGDDFVAGGKVIITNLPAGFTARIIRTSSLSLVAVLTGTATLHNNSNDISNLGFAFQNSAFSGGDASRVISSTKSNLSVDFIQIYNVGPVGDFTTIAGALAVCDDRDVLNLAAGVFTEANLLVEKDITIKGQGANSTFVQSGTSAVNAVSNVFFAWFGTDVTIMDLTVRYGTSNVGGGILSDGTQLNLINLDICWNTATSLGSGVYVSQGCPTTIVNSSIHDNTGGSGIYIEAYAVASIVNSTIAKNSHNVSEGGGIYCELGSVNLTNCTVGQNTGYGLWVYSGNVSVINTILADNTLGDYRVQTGVALTDNGFNIVENQSANGVSGDWHFTNSNDILYNYKADGSASAQWTRNNTALANQTLGLSSSLIYVPGTNTGSVLAYSEGSFIRDAGTDAGAPLTDQLGRSRYGTTDIGAVEYLGVPAIVPTVTTTAITTFNSTTATLGGNVTSDGGATVTERGVVYSLSGTPDISDTKVQIGSGTGTYSQSVSGFEFGTTYYVRAYAINSAGNAYGSVQTVTTPIIPPSISSTPVTTVMYEQRYNYQIEATTVNGNLTTFTVPTLPAWLTFTTGGQSTASLFGNISTGIELGGVAGGSGGSVYAITLDGTEVYKIESDGTTSLWKSGLLSGTVHSLLIAGDYLYIPRYVNATQSVTRIPISNPSAAEETFTTLTEGALSLTDKDDWIYASDFNSSQIYRIHKTTKEKQLYLDVTDGVPSNGPFGLTFGLDGSMYIATYGNNSILKYNGSSMTTVLTGVPQPCAIQQDVYGNFYISTVENGVRKYTSDFASYLVISTEVPGFISDLSLTTTGTLFYAISATNEVYRFQTCTNLTGIPAKSDVGNHPVVVRATNDAGFAEQNFSITVADTIQPQLTALSPADGATGVAQSPSMSFTFDEEVSLGSSGILSLQSGGSTLISFDLADADDRTAFSLSPDNKTLSFNIPIQLPGNSNVGVEISNGFVNDLSENSFAGISIASGSWNFTIQQTCFLSSGPAPKVADLVVTAEPGAVIKWYTAETGGTLLSGTTTLTTATDYWASQTVNGVESSGRFRVTATVNDCYITITTTAASDILATTATSGGTISNNCGAAVTASGVCWSTSTGPIATGNHTTGATSTGSFTSSITGLSSGTTYYVRAYATNTSGTAYGNEVSFTTP